MTDTGVLDLDRETDFELMEVVAKYLFEKNNAFAVIYENIVRHATEVWNWSSGE
jgi:CMP-N,N'-diacetyllegionaminic acid synthase